MSGYKPRQQGRKDARQGKPRYMHKSAWNQEQYDNGYRQGCIEVDAINAKEAKRLDDEAFDKMLREIL